MAEEEKTQPTEEEESKEEESSSVVDKAYNINKSLEENIRRFDELVKRAEKLAVMNSLGGKSEAGKVPEEPKEETPEEYKDRVMKGEMND